MGDDLCEIAQSHNQLIFVLGLLLGCDREFFEIDEGDYVIT